MRPVIVPSGPPRRLYPFLISLSAALFGAAGCGGDVECKTEVTDGAATFTGKAVGKQETESLRREATRDACRQRCAAARAAMIDACTAACVTDVGAQKLGGRTTCGRK